MEYFLQQLINGITLGSIYGLIAIGYTMVFGIIGMVNFSHGDIFMVSAFVALIVFLVLTTWLGMASMFFALIIMLVVAMAVTGLWSWTIEKLAYRPLRGSFRLAPLISAIGMSLVLSNFVQVAQDPRNKPVPPMFTDVIQVVTSAEGFNTVLSYRQIAIVLITTLLLAAFWYVVQKTSLGRAQRACEQDRKMAALLGIDVDRTISATFVIGAALAAVAVAMTANMPRQACSKLAGGAGLGAGSVGFTGSTCHRAPALRNPGHRPYSCAEGRAQPCRTRLEGP